MRTKTERHNGEAKGRITRSIVFRKEVLDEAQRRARADERSVSFIINKALRCAFDREAKVA